MTATTQVMPEIGQTLDVIGQQIEVAKQYLKQQFDFDTDTFNSDSQAFVTRLDVIDVTATLLKMMNDFNETTKKCLDRANELGEKLTERG